MSLLRYSDKFRREPPRPRFPSTPVQFGKYQWNYRPGGDADKDVQGEAINKSFWSEGKNTGGIYLELHDWDDVADDAFKVESDKTNVSLTIASVAGKQRIFKLVGLAHEIAGIKVDQKKGKQSVSLKLAKMEEKTWHKLLDDRQHATESSHIVSTEVVVDDTTNSHTETHLVSARRH